MALFRFGSRSNQSKAVVSINHPIPDFGADLIADTSLHTLNAPGVQASNNQTGWAQVYIIADTVFDAATICNIAGLATVSIKAGTTLYGIFATIKLTSGSVVAYRATDPNA